MMRARVVAGRRAACGAIAGLLLFGLAGCHTDMWVQNKVKPLQESAVFLDGQASRRLPPGTVARGELRDDELMYRGIVNGKMATVFPFAMTRTDLERGRQRFDVYCSPCHGRLGDGNGMISQRGLALARQPASYHTDRLRKMPVGHFYDVITNGFGVMYSYAQRVEPADRWRIAAYIRVLQLSQNAKVTDLAPEEQAQLKAAGAARPAPTPEAVR